MNDDDDGIVSTPSDRIVAHAPITMLSFFVFEQTAIDGLMNHRRHGEQRNDAQHPFGNASTGWFVERNAAKDGDRAFDRHACLEPIVDVEENFQDGFDCPTTEMEHRGDFDQIQLRTDEKPELEDDDQYGEERRDRGCQQVQTTADLLDLFPSKRDERSDAADRTNDEHQCRDGRSEKHHDFLL